MLSPSASARPCAAAPLASSSSRPCFVSSSCASSVGLRSSSRLSALAAGAARLPASSRVPGSGSAPSSRARGAWGSSGCSSRGGSSGRGGSVAVRSSSIVAIDGVRPEIDAAIASARVLTETDLGVGTKYRGKVRDTYDLGDKLVIVTTDRQSAFDRHLASVPLKGAVLNRASAWWMEHTRDVAPNALLSVPHPNASIMRRCDVFPVEFVVRGYATGSTDTSLWTHYAAGVREYCGHSLPEGLRKNDRLPRNLVTPTTKSETHDEPVSGEEAVERGLLSRGDWEAASSAALALFARGQAVAARRGLVLVDTKYEFGRDPETGRVVLVDEIHTPDSSRYWIAGSYEQRHAQGLEPESVDKEFLRLWFRNNSDPYNDATLPEAPQELVRELARRYVYLYETITGEEFVPPTPEEQDPEGLKKAVERALDALGA